ncbi:MAG: PP2C family protein-serine/threonine phosphatase [Candidatus Acidiferrales bacterium]
MPYNPLRMAAGTNIAQKKSRRRSARVRAFWGRVTEGMELQQLWGQFVSEAKASYGLYSKDVDWEEIGQERSRFKRFRRSVWAMFVAMLMKLSPSRRVLLLAAVVFLLLNVRLGREGTEFSFNLGGLGVVILFVLLALELADRVTMKRDLEIAREIQQWLVPASPPSVPGVDIAFATRPQNTVAGDYYDAFLRPLPSGDSGTQPLLIAVADVAGKSVPAALLMATFQASLRALAATPVTLDEIVTGLDRYCRAYSLEGRRFTTAFLAEVNTATHEMLYVNAGQNNPILRRASGEIERLAAGGPPFGLPLFTESEVSYGSGRVQLQPGDLLFIFTDGVVEAIDGAGAEYGEARLVPCIQNAPPESASATLKRAMADVNAFVGYARQHDDITCLVLRIGV